ncbi:MAG TPA: hypothetical protein VFN38_06950, partial [Gemmatimonadaceae bacterium]|nr:hypothetical protein [Gemmatimonadaceae bacterium]
MHLPGTLDGLQRETQLRIAGRARQLFDGMAVAIAAPKVHAPVDAGRVPLQHLLDEADVLEELTPIERPDEAQAGNEVR